MSRPLVVIPTYNERENLATIVGRVRTAVPDASVLVVDDASPDGTGVLADELAAADGAVNVLHRAGKEGLGAAYLAAFDWALGHGYDPIVQMDADGSHLPEQLPSMLAALAGVDPAGEPVDLVIGSRWVAGGSIENWPRRRQLLSRGGSAYARWVLRLPTRDATAGYRAFRAAGLRRIGLEDVHTRGYGFQVDMLWHARDAGLTITEVPVTFVERERGRSKMSLGIVVEAMLRVTGWGIASRFRRTGRAGRGAQPASSDGSATRRSRA
ncbi:polyprenol monophosphomannose synthase [Agromyces sp. NPDC058064]|uniref:polyprenol monophosphomannose synthase n=1 Tax=Agromyces sp. NPDC058064 TaxID=3346322 RepID=UPI0036DB33EA